jgi:hypothetical protein
MGWYRQHLIFVNSLIWMATGPKIYFDRPGFGSARALEGFGETL